MSYEKPELFILTLAAGAVRGFSDGVADSDSKSAHCPEFAPGDGRSDTRGHNGTSTTTPAYEVDE